MTSSHRYTTTSRRPGVTVHGVVDVQKAPLRVCEDCGAVTTEAIMPGQHGVHLRAVGGRTVRVNCVGKPVEEE